MTEPVNYVVRSANPVFMLGDGVFVVPGANDPDPTLYERYIAPAQQVTSYAADEVTKYAVDTTTGTTNCTGASGSPCRRVPPYTDMVPSPATVFGTSSALASVGTQEHATLTAAMARINSGVAPTGFWLLKTGTTYVTIEVGIIADT